MVVPNAPVGDAMVDTLHAFRDGTWNVSNAVVSYLAKAEERAKKSADPRTFVLTSAAQLSPLPPHSGGTPATAASVQPTVVVIKESGNDSRSATIDTGGIILGVGSLLGLGIGVLGIGIGYAGWRRRMTPLHIPSPPSPPAVPGDGILLSGKYNAGPRRETAERFEIGPSYQTTQAEKKQTEAEKQQAVLEHILSQNIALHAQLATPVDTSETNPETTDSEPYAVEIPMPDTA
jgi:hypothetical protein